MGLQHTIEVPAPSRAMAAPNLSLPVNPSCEVVMLLVSLNAQCEREVVKLSPSRNCAVAAEPKVGGPILGMKGPNSAGAPLLAMTSLLGGHLSLSANLRGYDRGFRASPRIGT